MWVPQLAVVDHGWQQSYAKGWLGGDCDPISRHSGHHTLSLAFAGQELDRSDQIPSEDNMQQSLAGDKHNQTGLLMGKMVWRFQAIRIQQQDLWYQTWHIGMSHWHIHKHHSCANDNQTYRLRELHLGIAMRGSATLGSSQVSDRATMSGESVD